jgi:hypothetical protein
MHGLKPSDNGDLQPVKQQDIEIVDKVNGATICTRPNSQKDLRSLIKESGSSLGELWLGGSLGGV